MGSPVTLRAGSGRCPSASRGPISPGYPLRREAGAAGGGHPEQAEPADEDDRLRLLFTCCHPALSHEAQVALTLRTVCGLSPAEIARAFLVSESAIVQRLTRARRKIATAGIPYRVPDIDHLAERLDAVVRASRLRRPGPYQLQAAIVACNAEAATWEATDWPQILLLYDALYARLPTPVVGLHRAIAVRQVVGSNVALAELDALAGPLAAHHLFHATSAQLLRDLGRATEARVADERALGLTENPAERALLEQRLV
jgi:predicted RNA polymerase sigma factor